MVCLIHYFASELSTPTPGKSRLKRLCKQFSTPLIEPEDASLAIDEGLLLGFINEPSRAQRHLRIFPFRGGGFKV